VGFCPVAHRSTRFGFYPPGCGFDSCRGRFTEETFAAKASFPDSPRCCQPDAVHVPPVTVTVLVPSTVPTLPYPVTMSLLKATVLDVATL